MAEPADVDVLQNEADPLFEEDERGALLPVKYPTLWEAYKTQEALHWFAHDVDLSKDAAGFKTLDANEQHFIKHVLAFFASSDLIVNENLERNFKQEIKAKEAQAAYTAQTSMELVHSEMYALLIMACITDQVEQQHLFNAVRTIPIIQKKAAWANKWMDSALPFEERLVAFSCIEGIFFCGSFCAIYWIKEMHGEALPGLIVSNEYIMRDESTHTEFAILLHSMLKSKCKYERFKAIITEAVELETEFITEALPCRLIGMNAELMKQYIRYMANRQTQMYGFTPVFDQVSNPFPFMERALLRNKNNFFEKKPTEYSKGAMQASSADPFSKWAKKK